MVTPVPAAAAAHKDIGTIERKARLPFRVLPRVKIEGAIQGPAIVTEATTTTYVDADWTVANGAAGELVLEKVA